MNRSTEYPSRGKIFPCKIQVSLVTFGIVHIVSQIAVFNGATTILTTIEDNAEYNMIATEGLNIQVNASRKKVKLAKNFPFKKENWELKIIKHFL